MTRTYMIDRSDVEEPDDIDSGELDDSDVYDAADTDAGDWVDVDDPDADISARGVTRWTWPVRLVTLAVVAVLGALTGFFGWHYARDHKAAAAAGAALAAADAYAVTLTSVDPDTLDANFAAVLDGSTGEFHDMYAKSSDQLRKLLIDHKATGHGVVVNSAVKSAGPDEAVVLLFVDQTVANTEVRDPQVDHSRMVMTMRNVDGRWKAAKVELP
ncbi:MAG: hypothetical protein WAV90_07565 [Gordonia amarae]|jgi:Mce-associated membrane protein